MIPELTSTWTTDIADCVCVPLRAILSVEPDLAFLVARWTWNCDPVKGHGQVAERLPAITLVMPSGHSLDDIGRLAEDTLCDLVILDDKLGRSGHAIGRFLDDCASVRQPFQGGTTLSLAATERHFVLFDGSDPVGAHIVDKDRMSAHELLSAQPGLLNLVAAFATWSGRMHTT